MRDVDYKLIKLLFLGIEGLIFSKRIDNILLKADTVHLSYGNLETYGC